MINFLIINSLSHTHVRTHIHVHIYTYMHTNIYTYTYLYAYIHLYAYMYGMYRDKCQYTIKYKIQSYIIIITMMKTPLLLPVLLVTLLTATLQTYTPELQLCSSTQFLNRQLKKYGPIITKKIDEAQIPNQAIDEKIDGIHVQANLSKLNQTIKINWVDNIINVIDQHTFVINSKNINVTIDGHIEFKLGLAPRQQGQITIQIEKLEADTTLTFTQPHCGKPNTGIGFDLQIKKLYINTQKIDIHITKKTLDNALIKAILGLLKSRLPSIIQKNAIQKGNPAISKLTCSPIQQLFPLGQSSYIAVINTTNVPHFIAKQLYAELDVTFVNTATNATNQELENDNLPEIDLFGGKAQVSVLASSNFMNSVLWLIDDSKAINLYVNNSMLGPNPPIELNTLNLSILLPGLMKWPRKEVYVGVSTSNKFSHLYIRNGKMIAVLSLSIKFIVNNTGQGEPIPECIQRGHCIVACDLNATIPFSAAIHIDEGSVLRGLVHTVGIEELQKIESQIEVKTEGLKKILNTMIGSARPQINQLIQTGIKIDLSKAQKFDVKELLMLTKKDYAAVGIVFNK